MKKSWVWQLWDALLLGCEMMGARSKSHVWQQMGLATRVRFCMALARELHSPSAIKESEHTFSRQKMARRSKQVDGDA